MFKNYFLVSWRTILKHKVFSFINIFGLAVSMSVCLLLILMLHDQMQFDEFHANKEHIYRIITHRSDAENVASTPGMLASKLADEYTDFEKVVQLGLGVGGDVIYEENHTLARGFFTNDKFFDVFNFQLVKGDPNTALQAPYEAVISQEIADKLFQGKDPIGETIKIDDRRFFHIDMGLLGSVENEIVPYGEFTVKGVLANEKLKSHLKFDILVSSSTIEILEKDDLIGFYSENWTSLSSAFTYVLTKENVTETRLNEVLEEVKVAAYKEEEENLQKRKFIAQPLTEITPGSFLGNPASFHLPMSAYFFLGGLALLVMISAAFNYTNLSIARAMSRAKEVGVRKVIGAKRSQVIAQFLSEATLFSLLALVIAITFLSLTKVGFMNLWVSQFLSFNLTGSLSVYLMFAVFAVLVGCFAGFFPAFYLSKFKPVQVLKNLNTKRKGKLGWRKALLVTQFTFSILFISTTLVIYQQVYHYLNFEYGFQAENIINVSLEGNDFEQVKNVFTQVPEVTTISASGNLPATGIKEGTSLSFPDSLEGDAINGVWVSADENFLKNIDLKLIAGKGFDELETDLNKHWIIVNKMTTEKLGFKTPAESVGTLLMMEEESVEILGVVNDFQYGMALEEIMPTVIRFVPEKIRFVNLKITTTDMQATLARLEEAWEKVDPIHEFRYDFYEYTLNGFFRVFKDIATVIGYLTFLAIVISCLGLLGMATYTAESRKKEIGIRKVLGANISGLILLLSRSFLYLLGIAILIAIPMTYFFNQLWLENLANRSEPSIWLYLGAVAIILSLGFLTIGSQALRAAKSQPIKTLRIE